jgi:hypothetical protein
MIVNLISSLLYYLDQEFQISLDFHEVVCIHDYEALYKNKSLQRII